MQNNYYDATHPMHPYTHSAYATPGSLPPDNSLRGESPPTAPVGFWPGEKDGIWVDIEDHRGEEGYINGEPFTVKDFGPYPNGWSVDPPAPPDPTDEEKYYAERAAVESKYSAPWNGTSAGILIELQNRMSVAGMQSEVLSGDAAILAIRQEYSAQTANKASELAAIDQKYGV